MHWYDDVSPRQLSQQLLGSVEDAVRSHQVPSRNRWEIGNHSPLMYSVHRLSFDNVGSDEHPALSRVSYHLARFPSSIGDLHNRVNEPSVHYSVPERHHYIEVSGDPFVDGERYGDIDFWYGARERVWDQHRSEYVMHRQSGDPSRSDKQFILGTAVEGLERLVVGRGPKSVGLTPGRVVEFLYEETFSQWH